MAIETLYPAIRPSLNLDFAGSKTLDPRITFSRASTATYYDGKTVAKAEENLLSYSQTFDNAIWDKGTGATISADTFDTVAPNATNTADKIFETATTSSHRAAQASLSCSLGQFSASVFWKKGTRAWVWLSLQIVSGSNTTTQRQWFNLDTVSKGQQVAVQDAGSTSLLSFVSSAIVDVGGGWSRLNLIANCTSATGSITLNTGLADAAASLSYAGSVDNYGYIWGAQLEQRSQVTAYTPTTSQPITNYIPVLQTAPAGVPRFDHNPLTGESLGLLVEEQRTNLLLRSQDFITANWLGTGSGVAVSCIAPDASLSGHKLSEDLTSGVHYRYQGLANVSGTTTYTLSAYVKAAGRSRVQLWSASGSPRFSARFDLASKTATGLSNVGGAVLLASTIEAVGNDWFRVSITGTTGADNILGLHLFLDNGSNHFYQGDGYSGIYIWGAQIEVGTFPTSYIKTEASQATRAADSASMTGANFSSWYRKDEGTFYGEASVIFDVSAISTVVSGRADTVSLSDSTSANAIMIGPNAVGGSNLLTLYASVGGSPQCNITQGLAGSRGYKFAAAVSTDDFALALFGYAVLQDTAGLVPVKVDRLFIGSRAFSGGPSQAQNGHIKRITYYPKRLANAQLQALTA